PRAVCLAAPASPPTGPAARTRASVTPRPTGTPLRLGPRFIDHEIAVSEKAPVQHLDRLRGLLFGGHLDKPESARPSRELVGDDSNRLDGASLCEEFPEIFLRGLERKVTDKQLSGHRATLLALTKAAEKRETS